MKLFQIFVMDKKCSGINMLVFWQLLLHLHQLPWIMLTGRRTGSSCCLSVCAQESYHGNHRWQVHYRLGYQNTLTPFVGTLLVNRLASLKQINKSICLLVLNTWLTTFWNIKTLNNYTICPFYLLIKSTYPEFLKDV